MKQRIYFIYRNHPPFTTTCESEEDAESNIRYWLGKSPGIYANEIKEILVIPNNTKSWLYVIEKVEDERIAYENKINERAEREQYERLKKKYEIPL